MNPFGTPITPSDEQEALRRGEPASAAGGLPAVYHAMRLATGQAGARRAAKALRRLNQKDGFDCPSCAWPDPDGERSPAEFCENGAKAAASETTLQRADREFFRRHSVSQLARQSDYWLEQQGRLTEPMIRRAGSDHYEPVSWSEAFSRIGAALRRLPDPNHAIFYTSGRASNEAAFLYQLFARAFGTNNLPDCSNMCHESSGLALKQSIGVGKGTVSLRDLREAELILVIGQNPGTNHPRMLSTLQQAREKGARIVSINPLREAGLVAFSHPQRLGQLLGGRTPLAESFIRVRNNGDQALFQGVAKRLFERARSEPGVIDRPFLNQSALGFEKYERHVDSIDWPALERASGLERTEMEALGDRFASAERIISCWAMGLTQHRNAVATIHELVNLHLLRGAVGKPGAGLCPVRGHSNVQGDRTMGIAEAMPEEFYQALEAACGIVAPRQPGLNTVQAIRDMRGNPGRVFIALGGNFLSASPDTEYTAEALRGCSLTVQVSTKLNRSHLVTGQEALILPCLGRSERDVQDHGQQWLTVENSMGIIHATTGALEPASSELKSEVAIVCGMAEATVGPAGQVGWAELVKDYGRIRSLIERVVPGFERYNDRARQPGGFYLPNPVKERCFPTACGKALFHIHQLDIERPEPGRLLLMTIRSHDQFNTTVYGLDDRYRGIRGARRVILLNPTDMEERDLRADELVDVVSFFEGERRICEAVRVAPYDLPRSVAAMYFPEANALVPIDHVAIGSHTPASKSVQVEVRLRANGKPSGTRSFAACARGEAGLA